MPTYLDPCTVLMLANGGGVYSYNYRAQSF